MKMRRPHTVYLSRQAVGLLEKVKEITGPTGLVFPSVGRGAKPMSENTMNQALRRMGIPPDEHSSHGFRATASTLLNGSQKWGKDIVEASPSHKDHDSVRAAYARGQFDAELITMAQWWADYLDRLRGAPAKVVQISRA
jgi:integrase